MAVLAGWVASLLNRKTVAFNAAVASITYRALARGYSLANIQFLAKQIAHETGWGTSNSIDVDQNAWGMNCVSVRETTQIGCRQATQNEVLGQYDSVDSSCHDRLLWDDYWGYDAYKSNTQYPIEIAAKYHTSTGYASAVGAIDNGPIRIAVFTAILLVPVELFMLTKVFQFIKR